MLNIFNIRLSTAHIQWGWSSFRTWTPKVAYASATAAIMNRSEVNAPIPIPATPSSIFVQTPSTGMSVNFLSSTLGRQLALSNSFKNLPHAFSNLHAPVIHKIPYKIPVKQMWVICTSIFEKSALNICRVYAQILICSLDFQHICCLLKNIYSDFHSFKILCNVIWKEYRYVWYSLWNFFCKTL